MNIASPQEASNFTPKEIYTGKASYNIIAVNPDNAWLKEHNQYTTEQEPDYTFSREQDGRTITGINIKVYLQSAGNKDIIDSVVYSLVNDNITSATGKYKVINRFGDTTWLEESAIASGTMPSNMQWYLTDGVKKVIKGEEELVKLIRASRNFKNISDKSTPEDKASSVSIFEQTDLDKMLRCDFNDIRKVLVPSNEETLKTGFLLGARTNSAGKVYQDLYKEYPLRPYQVSNNGVNQYLVKDVSSSQENGRYSNTYFDLTNLEYQKYNESSSPSPTTTDDLMMSLPGMTDDLPF